MVLAGEAAPSTYMWVIWLATIALVGIVLTATDVARSRAVVGVALVATLVALLALHKLARRFQWRVVLEGSLLRIERLAIRPTRPVVALDVSRGLKLAFDVSPHPASIELRLVLITDSGRSVWSPGQRVAPVVDALVRFLREHNVDVSDPPPLPVGWSAPTSPFGAG